MRLWSIVAALILLSTAASAQANVSSQKSVSPLWNTDVDGVAEKIFLRDINGDGKREIITDSVLTTTFGKSGIVYALDYKGAVSWRYYAGLLDDIYVSDKGTIVVATGGQIAVLEGDGKARWKRSVKTNNLQKVYGQTVYAGDLDGDGSEEVVSASNFGLRGSSMQLWNSGGNSIASIDYRGGRFPVIITSADLNNDGKREIVIGSAVFAPNTLAGTITLAYSKPALVQVMNSDGAIVWEADTPSGVSSLALADIDNDTKTEILVGVEGRIIVYAADGKEEWDKEVGGTVHAIKVADVNGDGSQEIAIGAGQLYLKDATGKSVWAYSTGPLNDIEVADFDGDGRMEVATAGQEVRLVDSAGKLVWKSDKYGKVLAVRAADMQSDGYVWIISGGDDRNVRAFSTERYSRGVKAAYYYDLADGYFKKQDYNASKYNALKAKEFYVWLSDEPGSTKAQNLAEKSTLYMGAEGYYNLSVKYLSEGNYGNASYYAQKALEEYRKVQDVRMLNEVTSILGRGNIYPAAMENLNLSRYYYNNELWANASFYAGKSKEQYAFIGDSRGMEAAEEVAAKTQKQLKALQYIETASNHTLYGEYENASYYFRLANSTYAELNYSKGMENVAELMGGIGDKERRGSVLIYVGVFVVLLIAALAGFIAFMAFRMISKRGQGKAEGAGKEEGGGLDVFRWLRWSPEKDSLFEKKPKKPGGGLSNL